jgi:hypothetical protein
MRSRLVTGCAVALVAVTGIAATALHPVTYSPRDVDHQMFRTFGPFSLVRPTTDWRVVPTLGPSDGITIVANSGVTATLSVQLHGAPVEFRVMLGRAPYDSYVMLRPGVVRFDPGTAVQSFTFSFLRPLPTTQATYEVVVDYRSPTGAPIDVDKGSVIVQYGTSDRTH